MKEKTSINLKNYKIVTRGKVYWIAPKKHSGCYPCDMLIVHPQSGKTVFRPVKITKTKQVYKVLKVRG